jgi:hypothetical protein
MLSNIIKEQEARYIFASEFVNGNVLDVSHGRFMAYHGANILLNGETKEVWNYDFFDENNIDIRKNFNKRTQFKSQNIDVFKKKFSSIILFESSYSTHSLSSKIINFSKLLDDDGVFIISIFNGELDPETFSNIQNIERLTKNEIEIILNKVFKNVTIYSQLLLSKQDNLTPYFYFYASFKQSIRNILGPLLLKLDKKSIFYQSFLQKIISRFDKSSEIINNKIFDKKYEPILFEEGQKPTYFIVVCKK